MSPSPQALATYGRFSLDDLDLRFLPASARNSPVFQYDDEHEIEISLYCISSFFSTPAVALNGIEL